MDSADLHAWWVDEARSGEIACRWSGQLQRRGVQNVAIISSYVGIYNAIAADISGENATVTIFRLRGN
jgi:hypothetical protein